MFLFISKTLLEENVSIIRKGRQVRKLEYYMGFFLLSSMLYLWLSFIRDTSDKITYPSYLSCKPHHLLIHPAMDASFYPFLHDRHGKDAFVNLLYLWMQAKSKQLHANRELDRSSIFILSSSCFSYFSQKERNTNTIKVIVI